MYAYVRIKMQKGAGHSLYVRTPYLSPRHERSEVSPYTSITRTRFPSHSAGSSGLLLVL